MDVAESEIQLVYRKEIGKQPFFHRRQRKDGLVAREHRIDEIITDCVRLTVQDGQPFHGIAVQGNHQIVHTKRHVAQMKIDDRDDFVPAEKQIVAVPVAVSRRRRDVDEQGLYPLVKRTVRSLDALPPRPAFEIGGKRRPLAGFGFDGGQANPADASNRSERPSAGAAQQAAAQTLARRGETRPAADLPSTHAPPWQTASTSATRGRRLRLPLAQTLRTATVLPP